MVGVPVVDEQRPIHLFNQHQARHLMRHVFENKEEARQEANKLHQRIVGEYNWPNSVRLMHEKLRHTYVNLGKKGPEHAKSDFVR